MKRLQAHEIPLHKVFSSEFDFQIPDYQRPYAWETEQAEQLLADLVESLDRNGDEQYFLGSIVLVKDPEARSADVIDGQQRLTTLTIVLAVLRDLAEDANVRQTLEVCLVEPGNALLGLKSKPRLRLRPRDAAFFRTYIQEADDLGPLLELRPDALATDSQGLIQANARVLRAKLADWPDAERTELASLMLARTFLVVVSTSDVDSAHRIFSVMNDRGLDLSPADIFKAKTIGALPDGISEDYAREWENAEQLLGRERFADLFLQVRMIFAKERARKELLKEFPEQVLDSYLPERAKEFVDDVVVPYAKAYESLLDESYSALQGADRVNAWLSRLNLLEANDWHAPALWALREHGDNPEALDDFLRALERLAASMLIRRVYPSPRAERYASLLRELDDGRGLHSPSFQLTPQEKQDTLRLLDGNLYLVTRVRKYVLLRLDQMLVEGGGVTHHPPLITVEHVLPQTPDANSEWASLFTPDQRDEWTHRLSNLVLLNRAKNSSAQNYDFERKKQRYFAGRNGFPVFALTVQVLNEPTWSPEVLERRQAELLDILAAGWDLR